MANPTTYFGWVMPNSADLVTDLPADFNVFGQGVDTSMQDLLGGTTGQVLSKTSGTNMDFTWVTPTDQTPLTTKGDLFTFSTVDARLPVGATNGMTLQVDSAEATGLKWATASSGALTKIVGASFTASAGLSVNNCFTSTYKNYRVMFRIKASTAAGTIAWRWRASGADLTGGGYYYGWNLTNNNATTTLVASNATTQIDLGGVTETGFFNNYTYDVFGPQANTQASNFYGGCTFTNAGQRGFGGGVYTPIAAYDGFSLITSQNITGEYVVYGYEN